MSNSNIMRSKITIDTASNFKPCIRVVEPQSHYMIDESEDVRDKLVKGFRELLHHTSSTVELIHEGDGSYILYPVEDELSYIGCLVHKWLHDSEARVKLKAMAHKILIDLGEGSVEDPRIEERKVFDKFNSMCVESLSPENFEALEKINDELTTNRQALRMTTE